MGQDGTYFTAVLLVQLEGEGGGGERERGGGGKGGQGKECFLTLSKC